MIVFIGDIFIYLRNEGEHMDHLRVVMQVLKEHQLFFRYSKCEFLLRSMEFLGHIISTESIEVDSKKLRRLRMS